MITNVYSIYNVNNVYRVNIEEIKNGNYSADIEREASLVLGIVNEAKTKEKKEGTTVETLENRGICFCTQKQKWQDLG